jgi:hypothetical protein
MKLSNPDVIFIRVRGAVLLHDNESIQGIPSGPVTVFGKNYYEDLFEIVGPKTGPLVPKTYQYLIMFVDGYSGGDNDGLRRKAVEDRLKSHPFVVKTKIHYNPTETVTNTIHEDEDIEVEE